MSSKTYACRKCVREFHNLRHYNRHLKSVSHTGTHGLKCNHCSKGYSRKDDLYKHLRVHHGVGTSVSSTDWLDVSITGSTIPQNTPVQVQTSPQFVGDTETSLLNSKIDYITDLDGNIITNNLHGEVLFLVADTQSIQQETSVKDTAVTTDCYQILAEVEKTTETSSGVPPVSVPSSDILAKAMNELMPSAELGDLDFLDMAEDALYSSTMIPSDGPTTSTPATSNNTPQAMDTTCVPVCDIPIPNNIQMNPTTSQSGTLEDSTHRVLLDTFIQRWSKLAAQNESAALGLINDTMSQMAAFLE